MNADFWFYITIFINRIKNPHQNKSLPPLDSYLVRVGTSTSAWEKHPNGGDWWINSLECKSWIFIKIKYPIFQHEKEDLEMEYLLLFYWLELEGNTKDKLINKHEKILLPLLMIKSTLQASCMLPQKCDGASE